MARIQKCVVIRRVNTGLKRMVHLLKVYVHHVTKRKPDRYGLNNDTAFTVREKQIVKNAIANFGGCGEFKNQGHPGFWWWELFDRCIRKRGCA